MVFCARAAPPGTETVISIIHRPAQAMAESAAIVSASAGADTG